MATTGARTATGDDPRVGPVYDGFISYSHAADDLLAPKLQAGLQRFAKPWWKRRAVRIFRDEASLSANPHLWSSITEALDRSDWFVLLLSPDAAESPWVNREVEYWLERKDRDRIIPVVTDGEFYWGGGDVGGDSVPLALHGAFADEPRSVDLRFATTEELLDIKNPQFSAAVADIASAIRGIPKDELQSEEVRQHRRTIRTAWAAAVALFVLVVVAGASAIYANGQRIEANEQRATAVDNAAEADAQRDVAEQQTDVAEELAFDARSDALAASAINQVDADPDLALLLATLALAREAQPAALTAVHQALQQQRLLFQVAMEPNPSATRAGAVGGLSPSGDRLVIATQGPDLEVWEIGGEKPEWSVNYEEPNTVVRDARFSDDGTAVVAFVILDSGTDASRGELVVFDALTGSRTGRIFIPGCLPESTLFPSSMSPYVDLDDPLPWVAVGSECGFRHEAGLFDPVSKVFLPVTEISAGLQNNWNQFGAVTTDATTRYLAVGAGGLGQVIDLVTGEEIFGWEGGMSTLSSDGTQLLAGGQAAGRPLTLWNLANGEELWAVSGLFTRGWFGNNEAVIYATSRDGATHVFEADTGELIHRIAEDQGTPMAATMSKDGTRLATFGTNFRGSVWDLGGLRPERSSYVINSTPRPHMAASATRGGSTIAVWGGAPREEDELWETTVLNLETGEQLQTVTGGAPALSPDGRLLAYRVVERVRVSEEADVHPRVGAVQVINVSTGELVTEIEVTCHTFLLPAGAVSDGCPISVGGETWDLEFSPDGGLLGMADSYTDIVYVWDVATGELVGTDQRPGANMRAVTFSPDGRQAVALTAGGDPDHRVRVYGLDPFALVDSVRVEGGNTFTEMVFTPDGALLVAASSDGTIAVFDTATWEAVDPIPARHGTTLDVAISDSGSLVASAGEDGSVRVWNVSDRSVVTEIKLDVNEIANVEFIDNTHLFVTAGFGNEAIVVTLDPDELLMIARDRIVRTFTPGECTRFEIDPCPTLAELKSGSA